MWHTPRAHLFSCRFSLTRRRVLIASFIETATKVHARMLAFVSLLYLHGELCHAHTNQPNKKTNKQTPGFRTSTMAKSAIQKTRKEKVEDRACTDPPPFTVGDIKVCGSMCVCVCPISHTPFDSRVCSATHCSLFLLLFSRNDSVPSPPTALSATRSSQ